MAASTSASSASRRGARVATIWAISANRFGCSVSKDRSSSCHLISWIPRR
ncbi:MAG: hypothetical protein ABSH30_11485 [Acidimicrobiales bacterium]